MSNLLFLNFFLTKVYFTHLQVILKSENWNPFVFIYHYCSIYSKATLIHKVAKSNDTKV